MTARLPPRLVLATGNAGKLRELAALLAPWRVEVLPQSTFTSISVEESGLTFVENAMLKARHAAAASGLPAIADDSGLEVDALDGAPGVRSARYAGEGAGDDANNARLLEALAGPEVIDELHASVMLEIGNILNSSFLNAISDMTQLKMHATPPVVSVDMAISVVSSIVCTAEEHESIALAVETSIYDEDSEVKGYFLCIPTIETLKRLFERLGIAEAA